MITAFRLVKKNHASAAFAGEGARRFGGRWNHKGTSVVYLSDTLSLAALEQFIHLGREGLHLSFVYFEVLIPERVSISKIEPHKLPKDWRNEPPLNSTKDIGTGWVQSGSASLLEVPSAIIPIGCNYLLNTARPDMKLIKISTQKPFSFDPRMWK
jgi:RES domain-containing protein